MCVNRGNNLDITIDRTAQLTAKLMRQYDIPLNDVVPHMRSVLISDCSPIRSAVVRHAR
jgi:hypothetical protein